MKVDLVRAEPPFHFVATGSSGVPVHIDASPDIGGTDAGARPMELLLMGLAGCASVDVVRIIAKQRLVLEDIAVAVTAERAEGIPAVFTAIHLAFTLTGAIPEDKARRAIDLSIGTYCSAAAILSAAAPIDYTLEILPGTAPGT